MTSNIKILDCTLRDGGYINNWEFGFDNIKQIILNLSNANIDFIECGFLKNIKYQKDKTIYSSIAQFFNILPLINFKTKYCLMINYGDINVDEISKNGNENLVLRLAFKKEKYKEALLFAQKLKDKGYNIFISPQHIYSYLEKEFINLLNEVNKINPMAYSIVDTIGVMTNYDVTKYFKIADDILDKKISICFHSHNNLKLSYSNAKTLMNFPSERELIIDCSLYGMGRGAGNLANELIIKDFSSYDIDLINETINNFIKPIYEKTPWGASLPYYLSANYKLHPNYATYLINKNISTEKMEEIFKLIPNDKKENFDIDIANNLLNTGVYSLK